MSETHTDPFKPPRTPGCYIRRDDSMTDFRLYLHGPEGNAPVFDLLDELDDDGLTEVALALQRAFIAVISTMAIRTQAEKLETMAEEAADQ